MGNSTPHYLEKLDTAGGVEEGTAFEGKGGGAVSLGCVGAREGVLGLQGCLGR